jgi:hypothetical protein
MQPQSCFYSKLKFHPNNRFEGAKPPNGCALGERQISAVAAISANSAERRILVGSRRCPTRAASGSYREFVSQEPPF